MTDTPVIEAMLLRWSESHNGRTVTLQLPADGEHPFRGLPCGPTNGARLAIAIARIADDETTTPVEPDIEASRPADGQSGEGHEMPKGGRRAREAGIACGEGAFSKYLDHTLDVGVCYNADTTVDPRQSIYAICGVKSRADLDHNDEAGRIWDELYSGYIMWVNPPL